MIRKTKHGYTVISSEGKKLSREYGNREDALKRLGQIEYFKHNPPKEDFRHKRR